MAGINLSTRIKTLLDQEAARHEVTQESFAHAVLLLALTDDNLMRQAIAVAAYFGREGQVKLDQRGI